MRASCSAVTSYEETSPRANAAVRSAIVRKARSVAVMFLPCYFWFRRTRQCAERNGAFVSPRWTVERAARFGQVFRRSMTTVKLFVGECASAGRRGSGPDRLPSHQLLSPRQFGGGREEIACKILQPAIDSHRHHRLAGTELAGELKRPDDVQAALRCRRRCLPRGPAGARSRAPRPRRCRANLVEQARGQAAAGRSPTAIPSMRWAPACPCQDGRAGRLQCDDPHAGLAARSTSRHAHQHAGGADAAAEDVDADRSAGAARGRCPRSRPASRGC